ncbi:MAG: serine protease [Deferribacterales bacterium]
MIAKFKLLILAAFLSVSVFSASATDVTAKIIGGTTVSSGAYPFVVAILDTTGGSTDYSQQFCGGTLIDSQWVMTAAHCMVDYTTTTAMSHLRILTGTNTLSTTTTSSGTKVSVSAVYVHESYNSTTYENDIALVKLSSAVSSDPIDSLSTSTYTGFVTGDDATVAGWGSTAYPATAHSYPTDLMEVDLPIVSNATCSGSYSTITDNMLCAGYSSGGKDSCSGDSGGPLFVNDGSSNIVVGIVSNGTGCALAGYYGVYTRVSQYASWVDGKMSGTSTDSGSTDSDTDSSTDTDSGSTDSSSGGGGGGCSASRDGSPIALVLMFIAGGIYLIRRKRA